MVVFSKIERYCVYPPRGDRTQEDIGVWSFIVSGTYTEITCGVYLCLPRIGFNIAFQAKM